MKTLFHFVLLLAVFFSSVSCTVAGKRMRRGLAAVQLTANGQIDYAALASIANSKGAQSAASFDVFVMQFGGTFDFDDGMGMKITADNQASFQHFCQLVGIGISAWSAASQAAAKFAYDKFAAGEITKQQFNQQMAALKAQELAAKEGLTGQMIQGGAELGPVSQPKF